MMQVHDKAIFLLRILGDMEAYDPSKVALSEVFERTGWTAKEYCQVDSYLAKKGWIKGDGFVSEDWITPNGTRTLTPSGTDALAEAMSYRITLSLLAERVARWLGEQDPLGEGVPTIDVIKGLGIDERSYEHAVRELLDLDLVDSLAPRTFGGSIVPYPRLTSAGRLAVKDGFVRADVSPATQQIGVQINAPISQSPIAGIVASQDITVNQAIEGADPAQLAEIGATYLDQIVDLVKDDLQGNQLTAYASAIQELKNALANARPDNSKLRRLISTVAFLDTANGAVELGKKGWELAAKVLPWIPILVKVIDHIV